MKQSQIERMIHPQHIMNDVIKDIEESYPDEIAKAVKAIRKWCDVVEWESKNLRKEFIRVNDLYALVAKLLAKITMYAPNGKPMTLISVAGMCHISGMEKLDSIKTVCELIALLEPLGLYSLERNSDKTVMIESLILPDEVIETRLNLYCYMPPMVERPDVLENNKSCGYKTIKADSLILGHQENYHEGCISLDVLNKLNRNQYELDNEFINAFKKQWHRKEQTPAELRQSFELAQIDEPYLTYEEHVLRYEQDKVNFETYQEQFEVLKNQLIDKSIYITNKVDKRGRIYAQGFHFSTMGSSFEKACINLTKKELIDGEL